MILKNLKPKDDLKPIIWHGRGELVLSHNEYVHQIKEFENLDIRNHYSISLYEATFFQKVKLTWKVVKYIFKY